MRPKEILRSEFLKMYLNSATVKKIAQSSVSSSGVGNLNVGTVRKFPIYLPPLETQDELIEKLNGIWQHVKELSASYAIKLQDLDDLRQSLLQKAFAGELT